jgi:DNA ligase D-like protein (predicted 3'-phosphoesterase)
MTSQNTLESYRERQAVRPMLEPSSIIEKLSSKPMFVVQKHQASTLHYDFRLEVNGILKSWAVPRGPSIDPRQKRLAIPMEDHPLDYAGFEGVIPGGRYGAGVVLTWDTGTYRNMKLDKDNCEIPLIEAIKGGHATFWLEGEKLKGGYALTRINRSGKERWLLVKMDDDKADANSDPVHTAPESVLSGRNIEDFS